MSFSLHGIGVSGGIAIGYAHLTSHARVEVPQYMLDHKYIDDELAPGRAGASALEARLRTGEPPVLVRVQAERVLLDLRTVAPDEDAAVLAALTAVLTAEHAREDA